MGLSINNNVPSLQGQHNLSRTNNSLAKSLERLSSGLKINRGADGPAALVISEQQRAQIVGIQTAIDNTSKAVNVVQTAEGALNEINRLLGKARGLALDSANSGVNDANSLAANQAEISNALDTITRIANTTQFGTKHLLNGEAAISGTVVGANNAKVGALKAGTSIAAGTYTVDITTQGSGGKVVGIAGVGSVGAGGGSLVINGGGLNASGVTVALVQNDTAGSAVTKIQSALDNAAAAGGGIGKFQVSIAAGAITIQSNVLGSAGVSVAASAGADTVTGFTGAQTTTIGANLALANIAGQTASITAGTQGLNNQVSFGGAEGLTFTVAVTNGVTALAAGTDTTVNVTDNGLVFQTGANAKETVKVSIDKATADVLGTGVSGLATGVANLSQINVSTFAGAQDAISVIDTAINEITTLRGELGAFQQNTLESTANNLRSTLENTVAAEATIRDTDFASETAAFTKNQVLLQAGVSVLQNANQTAQLVLGLLRG